MHKLQIACASVDWIHCYSRRIIMAAVAVISPLPSTSGGAGASSSPAAASLPAAAIGEQIFGRVAPCTYPRAFVTCCTKLGKRKKQEDRSTTIPRVHGKDDVMFLGIFDGTVGDFAADTVHLTIGEHICGSKPFREAIEAAGAAGGFSKSPAAVSGVEAAVAAGYQATDEQLLRMCAERAIDYSSCTSVTAVVAGDLLVVAHLGDSKVVLGREGPGGVIVGKYLTNDHKPDLPEERARIEKSGGSLAYLHGGKPFIRGGDFTERQARGERPMQLNYSRAFGGKDLKPFGLLATPDIYSQTLTKADRCLVLASDGLWDVATADIAARRAMEAFRLGRDPALELTDWALAQHDMRGTVDNVTVTVVIFR